jgi:antitoxin MazE
VGRETAQALNDAIDADLATRVEAAIVLILFELIASVVQIALALHGGSRRVDGARINNVYTIDRQPTSGRRRSVDMKMIVRKWGNSAAVRIPASVMAAASLDLDQVVDVREEGGRVVIEPMRAEPYDLNSLLDQMRPETFPEEVDFGPPQGLETW